jgi:hypothetical protein
MDFRKLAVAVVCACVLMTWPAAAQEGHPLKGSWLGTWTGNTTHDPDLVLVLNWDGKAITGTINPGAEAATVKSVSIDYTDPTAWVVKIQAEGKDKAGKPIAIAVDGKLENLGAYNKLFHGTWTEAGKKGDFTVTRN